MKLPSTLAVAFDALVAHKGRTALTSLGIVIGVGAVIALYSAGEGVRTKLDERLATVGQNVILIRAGSRTNQMAVADFAPLTSADAEALRKQVGSLLAGVAEVQITQRVASTGQISSGVMVVGSTPELQAIRSWDVPYGRFFTQDDMRRVAAVCVLGDTVRKKFFPYDVNPVGKSLRIDHTLFRVIGVTAPKGRSAAGADQDDQIFVPIATLQQRLAGEARINLIVAAAKSDELIPAALREIERIIRLRHKLKPETPADFEVTSVQELAELATVVASTLQGLLAVIASVSLIVGGVGVMNIMLVAVSERTREIGLRVAVGARPEDVLGQFLSEAVTLSLLGGAIGVVLGLITAWALSLGFDWPMVVPHGIIALAFGVSAAVGIVFGFYPAWKASRLEPITALRQE